jgi:long-chain acyl-CoA synthetase
MTLHPGTIARHNPDRQAVVFGESTMSYGTLDTQSRAIAAALFAAGLRQGDVLAMLIGNRPEFFAVAWAAQRSGLYYLPIPTRLTPPEIAYLLTDSGAKAIAIDPDFASVARAAMGDMPITIVGIHADDAGLPEPPAIEGSDMLYTSGSTGRPKGVRRPITGAPLGSDARRVARAETLFGLGADSVFFSPAPLYHAAPLRFMMNVLRTGGTVVGMRKFDAATALAMMADHHVTHSQWVPTMFVRMLALPVTVRQRFDLSTHRVAIHSAAPCPPDIKRAMIDWWGPIIHECYAATESVGFTHVTSREWLERPGTVGRSYETIIHVVDEDGQECAPGSIGTIYFEGRGGLSYHNDPDKTAAAHDAHGWATTGDIGYVDADGYLFLTDRRAFTIISGGVNIYPAEVEAAFAGHADIADIAVFGIPDADFGEAVFALVELLPGRVADASQAERLIGYARARLASYKLPKRIGFGDVGRTETGKLHKAVLRARCADGAQGFDVTRVMVGAAA